MPRLLLKLIYNYLVKRCSEKNENMNILKHDMKVLFLNPVGVVGGAERGLLTAMTALLNTQPTLQLYLITAGDGALVEQAEKLGVEVKVLELPAEVNQLGDSALKNRSRSIALLLLLLRCIKILPKLSKYLQQFRRVIKEIAPDIIHSNGIKAHLLVALARVNKIPVIWYIQDFYSSRPLVAKILKWMSGSTSLGVAISQAVAEDTKATIPRLPVKVVYHAVDVNYFFPNSTAFSVSPVPHVGLVATFARWKGHDVFLAAAAHIVKTRPELKVQFCIVGGAIYQTQGSQFSQEELRDIAVNLGIADRVTFWGFQSDVAAIYGQLDIVVHASTQPEPFGLVIVEAMACGRPVIVSQAGGAAELFTPGYDALGVPPGEHMDLANAILDLLDSPEKRENIAKQARKTAVERFSHERLGQQFLDIYQDCILERV